MHRDRGESSFALPCRHRDATIFPAFTQKSWSRDPSCPRWTFRLPPLLTTVPSEPASITPSIRVETPTAKVSPSPPATSTRHGCQVLPNLVPNLTEAATDFGLPMAGAQGSLSLHGAMSCTSQVFTQRVPHQLCELRPLREPQSDVFQKKDDKKRKRGSTQAHQSALVQKFRKTISTGHAPSFYQRLPPKRVLYASLPSFPPHMSSQTSDSEQAPKTTGKPTWCRGPRISLRLERRGKHRKTVLSDPTRTASLSAHLLAIRSKQ